MMNDNIEPQGEAASKQSQSTQIVELLQSHGVFADRQKQCFMEVEVDGHIEIWSLDSPEFTEWVAHCYFKTYSRTATQSSLKDALTTLKGQARYGGDIRESFLRAGCNDSDYWLDLGCKDWKSVHIQAGSWRVAQKSSVSFYRKDFTHVIPIPSRSGSIEPLWRFVNIPEENRLLVITALIDYLRPNTAHPPIILDGEQGSAKSTTQRYLKSLIDPSAMPLRVAPKNEQDFFVAAANDYVLSYNNISNLSAAQQDALCNLSTGGTYAKRALYSDNGEVVVNVQRPVMINGIGTLITQQDLLERCIYLKLPIINHDHRLTERELDGSFLCQQSSILGGLLDLMAGGLEKLAEVSDQSLPRMADFALLGRALCLAQGREPAEFDEAYRRNQIQGVESGLEASPIYVPLKTMLRAEPIGFYGTYSELLEKLEKVEPSRPQNWPKSSKGLANALKRMAPALRKLGYSVEFEHQRREAGMYVAIEAPKN